MTLTQTIDIPSTRQITINVPREIPIGPTIISFTPAPATKIDDCPICAKLRDPVTGDLPWNDKAIAAMKEGRAMMHGEIPVKWHKPEELEQVLKDIQSAI